jgi:uncharacterized membrane protein
MNPKKTWISIRTIGFLACILAGCFSAVLLNAQERRGTFSTIDFPGAMFTLASGINASGDIVGNYALPGDNAPCGHGFLLRRATFTTIDVDIASSICTVAIDINSTGSIVGFYGDSHFVFHGFLLSNGVFSTIDFPGAASTLASGINDVGEIVGFYCPTSNFCGSPLPPTAHGFVLSGGVFTSFDPPGSIFTNGGRINSEGRIAGYYQSADGKTHVFLRTKESTFTTFDPPGPCPFFKNSTPGINAQGEIVGMYMGTDGRLHGFLLTGGVFSTIDVPGAINNANFAINERDEIVGIYQSADGNFHGFVLARL